LRYFRRQKTAKFFTVAAFLALGAGLVVGIFLFFIEGFGYIDESKYFGNALFLYLYEMFFPILAFFLAFSGVIFGLFSLFEGNKNYWIMASPRYELLFVHKILAVTASSFWPFAIIALPFVVAVGVFFGLGFDLSLLVFFGLLIFCLNVILASLAIVFLVAGVHFIIGKILKKNLLSSGKLTASVLAVFVLAGMFFWMPMVKDRPGNIFDAEDLSASAAGVEKIEKQFDILPTHFIAKAVFETQNKNISGAVLPWSLNLIFFLAMAVFFVFLKKKFLFLWQKLQEGNFKADTETKQKGKRNAFGRVNTPATAFFVKESLKLFRNKKNLLWLFFSLLLWFLYSGINYFFINHSDFEEVENNLIPFLISALQFLVAVYFTVALVLRFSFPSFSEEKKSVWVIAGAPIDLGRIFVYRSIFYSLVFLLLGLAFASFNFIQFETGWLKFLLTLDMFALSIVFVSVLGLALGAIFPNFETDDPQQLSTSLPGLGFIFSSLAYGFLASYAFYRFYFLNEFWVYLIFGIASVVIILALIAISVKSLRKREFVKIF
jgi:ABC-2 type transport system permease protein